MRSLPRLLVSLVATLLLGSLAAQVSAAPAPGLADAFGDALSARRAELGEPTDKAGRKLGKTLDKAARALSSKKAGRSLVNEIKAAASAARLLEKKASGEAGLLGIADTTADAYEARLRSDLGVLDALLGADSLSRKKGKAAAKSGKRAHKGIDKLEAATTASRRLAALSGIASALRLLDALDVTGGDEYAWIIDSLTLAPAGTGLDLDGNGTPDNGLGAARQTLATFGAPLDLDAQLAAALADGSLVFVVQMWRVNAFDNDPFVFAGTLSPADGDADPSDNFSGVEILTPQEGTVDADGHALARTATAFVDGTYAIAVDQLLEIPLGGLPIATDGVVRVRGAADDLANDGLIGLTIPAAAVRGFVEQALGSGSLFIELAMGLLLDIDTDGDGTDDAMSLALEFSSVPVGLD